MDDRYFYIRSLQAHETGPYHWQWSPKTFRRITSKSRYYFGFSQRCRYLFDWWAISIFGQRTKSCHSKGFEEIRFEQPKMRLYCWARFYYVNLFGGSSDSLRGRARGKMYCKLTSRAFGGYEQVLGNVGNNFQKRYDKLQTQNQQIQFCFGQGTEKFWKLLLFRRLIYI